VRARGAYSLVIQEKKEEEKFPASILKEKKTTQFKKKNCDETSDEGEKN